MGLFVANKTQSNLPQRLRTKPASEASGDVVSTTVRADFESKNPSMLARAGKKVYSVAEEFMLPSNFPNSVSQDYAITRKWQLSRDLAGAVSWGYVAGMAISAATLPGIAAAGLTLFTYSLIKDRLNQAVGFVTSIFTPAASRNPRAWLLGGDIIDSAGVALMGGIALAPQYFVPISIGVGLAQTFAGTMRGAASADIGPRQAIADNLGPLQAKNGNQGLLAGNLGLAIGGAMFAGLHGYLGSATLPMIGAATAAAGLFATGRMLRHLDMHPVNEAAARELSGPIENGTEIPDPDRLHTWKALKGILKADKIRVGEKPALLKNDPVRFKALTELYADKNYLLESVDGKPFVVLKQSSGPADRFQAMIQCLHMEKLQASEEFAAVLANDGQDKADFWLVDQSLAKTPKDLKPELAKMQEAGWSTDMVRFLDGNHRAQPKELLLEPKA